jgi:inhibitor of KinA
MTVRLAPLGDRAVLAYLPDEAAAVRFAAAVRAARFSWLEDVVPAYASAGVYFDPARVGLRTVRDALAELALPAPAETTGRSFVIPCCYDFQLDLGRVSEYLQLAPVQVVERHTAQEFFVYAVGFCPGFPYLGYLPPELAGVPRLPAPRMALEAGSVGLTGRQTGLYPLVRPGGWNIIGRTPLELVHVEDGYFPLQVGDRVLFRAIDRTEYESLKGKRLKDLC